MQTVHCIYVFNKVECSTFDRREVIIRDAQPMNTTCGYEFSYGS